MFWYDFYHCVGRGTWVSIPKLVLDSSFNMCEVPLQLTDGHHLTFGQKHPQGMAIVCNSSNGAWLSIASRKTSSWRFLKCQLNLFLRSWLVRPGKWCVNRAHLGPIWLYIIHNRQSSSAVHGLRLTVGARKCWYLSRHCFDVFPSICSAIVRQLVVGSFSKRDKIIRSCSGVNFTFVARLRGTSADDSGGVSKTGSTRFPDMCQKESDVAEFLAIFQD